MLLNKYSDLFDRLDLEAFRHEMVIARTKRAMHQADLARLCGVGQGTISKIESGRITPTFPLVSALCEHLEISPAKLGKLCGRVALTPSFVMPLIKTGDSEASPLHNFHILIREQKIVARTSELCWTLMRMFPDGDIDLVVVATAGVVFGSQLLLEFEGGSIGFHVIRSVPTDQGISFTGLEHLNLIRRNVVLVDAICRSGDTLKSAVEALAELNPACIRTCVLIDQPSSDKDETRPDLVGFQMDPIDVFGFGLDDRNGHNRNLRHIVWTGEDGTKASQEPHREAPSITPLPFTKV